jgi:hypothetical protein
MKLFLIILLANLLAPFLRGVLGAAWKSLTTAKFPLVKWDDSKVLWRLSQEENGARYRVILNLQTPWRRREVRQQHAKWVERMKVDYNMDFSHTLPS